MRYGPIALQYYLELEILEILCNLRCSHCVSVGCPGSASHIEFDARFSSSNSDGLFEII